MVWESLSRVYEAKTFQNNIRCYLPFLLSSVCSESARGYMMCNVTLVACEVYSCVLKSFFIFDMAYISRYSPHKQELFRASILRVWRGPETKKSETHWSPVIDLGHLCILVPVTSLSFQTLISLMEVLTYHYLSSSQ